MKNEKDAKIEVIVITARQKRHDKKIKFFVQK